MKQRRLSLYRNPSRRMVEFYFSERSDGGIIYISQPVTMELHDNPVIETDPAFSMSFEDAQIFIDELWRDGFRPSNLSDGEFSAQGKHLEDMRRIAFKFLELP